MKWIIIILLLFVIVVFITARYRKQINAAIILWKSLTKAHSSASQIHSKAKSRQDPLAVELIKCAKCGSWTPSTNTLSLISGEKFCSSECIDEAILIKKRNAV